MSGSFTTPAAQKRPRNCKRGVELSWTVRAALVMAAFACGFAGSNRSAWAQDEGLPAWERRAYEVRVSLAVDAAAVPPGRFDEVRDELGDLLWRTFGEHWNLTFVPPPASLTRADAAGLRRLRPEDFPPPADPPTEEEPNPARPPDRWFVVTLGPAAAVGRRVGDPQARTVAAREWDGTRRVLGPVRTADATGLPAAVQAAGRLVRDLFHPEYRVAPVPDAAVDSNEVRLAARAAALPVRDPAVDPLAPGRWLSLFLRLYQRDGALRDIRETPYTFVRVGPVLDENDPARVQSGEVVSALRSAVGRTRGRTQTLARPIHQQEGGTTLRLIARGSGAGGAAGRPLVGYRVKLADRRTLPSERPPPEGGEERPEPEPIPEPFEEVSDRGGRITVPAAPPTLPDAEPTKGLVWLHVYSGKAKLGALPYVAGAVPADVLELDDDALRLGLEGEYALLSGEMLEVVAHRAVLTARAKKSAKEKSYAEAEARLEELSGLPRAEAFKRRIDALAAGVRAEALESGDRLTAARVAKLAEKMRELANTYLSADPLAAAKSQVAELKTLAEEIEERERRAAGRRARER
ncbi:hypothetical protein [Alienimonas californiensis]|uniref:Uncharacterized protein n=1 Tax=Alienimonas californiensis TaxID=2527989 RepID=A0A517PC87_9PLAN|nr:hypothetical protein [Alienimonas californiensis]QDT16998.1 hypothetical protein CA12_31080 [Alienimonas californiensis]